MGRERDNVRLGEREAGLESRGKVIQACVQLTEGTSMSFKYTWSAKDKFGQTVIKEVEAGSALEAQDSLLAEGYSDLQLKEDELMTTAQAGFPEKLKVLGENVQVTAEQRVQKLDNPPVTIWDNIKQHVNQSKFFFLLLILLSGYQFYRGNVVSGILIIGALVVWLAFLIFVGLPLVYYRKLILAADWNRWKEVLALVQTVRNIGKIGMIKVPDTELTRYRAKAFVGMGNLQKGIEEFQKCEGRPDCPSWLYKLFLAEFYGSAKQYDKAIELDLAAISENPSPIAWYDLTNRYARYKRDAVKARGALTEAEKSPAPAHVKPYRARCRGIIAYLDGDYSTARTELETAIGLLEQNKGQQGRDGNLAIARAYLCCVFAKQGDMESAKKNLNLAREYLMATDEDELLAECARLTGGN